MKDETSSMTPRNRILFESTDGREFLKQALLTDSKVFTTLSLRSFCRHHQIAAPSAISMFIHGTRPLPASVQNKIADAFAFRGWARKYFKALIDESNETDPIRKKARKEQLLRLKDIRSEKSMAVAQYSILSEWHYPALYALIGNQGFPKKNIPSLYKRFTGRIPLKKIELAFERLLSLNLVTERKGIYYQVDGAIHTDSDTRDLAIFRYHTEMLEQAKIALAIEEERREYNGLTVTVSPATLKMCKEKIRKFRTELNEWLSSLPETDENSVYQIGIQMFPLTDNSPERNRS
jgi:uncharacterized protein (TIGR02147 family)